MGVELGVVSRFFLPIFLGIKNLKKVSLVHLAQIHLFFRFCIPRKYLDILFFTSKKILETRAYSPPNALLRSRNGHLVQKLYHFETVTPPSR